MNSVRARRFRANPIEVAIFSVIMLVFTHSVYSLFYDNQALYTADIAHHYRQIASARTASTATNRTPSSAEGTSHHVIDLDFKCQTQMNFQTTASKVRIVGPICSPDSDSVEDSSTSSQKWSNAVVKNQRNSFQATLFPDFTHGKFSTDYIPLEEGENKLKLEFTYPNESTIQSELTLTYAPK